MEYEQIELHTQIQYRLIEKLSESEKRYRDLVENLQAIVFTIDQDQKIIFVNQAWTEIFGYSFSDSIGLEFVDFIHPEDKEKYLHLINHKDNQGLNINVSQELRFYHQQGMIVWIQLSGRFNSLNYLSGTLVDITQRKKAEVATNQALLKEKKMREKMAFTNDKLMITNAELDRATRLKDEFLANMSHELRTPLNAILGISEALMDEVYGTLNESQKSVICTIERSGKHLLELINDILELSKVESGKLELELTPVNCKHLCEFSLTFVKQQAIKKNLKLSLDIPLDLPDIMVDERRMRQVLINLLNNAVKFTPEGGRIKLIVDREEGLNQTYEETLKEPHFTTSNSDYNFDHQQEFLCFSITDTGIGIAPEDLPKLFQPFVQIDSKLNRKYNGTGLGLALVNSITKMHGGTITLTSELGKGSCFTVRLPYLKAPRQNIPSPPLKVKQQSASMTSTLNQDSQSPLILIAEDNEANISTIAFYLENRGYKLILAQNGAEAVSLAQTAQPNLILMDIQMPIMDGLEAIRQIRTFPHLNHIPIIALTALAMPDDRAKCFSAGANEYLTKPVRMKFLAETIQQLLSDQEF
ncbi:PAS domain-containing hybrid sensor histidine kinase/response regulator [Sphaerospermopsis aphanizomenoides]|uniref:PAS domain-containing hybrid sensor histidine kinase/response regulator n=1 Tax=Sphaerospermopsis aphanizomenoides TaxID=459663 RepID=UPI00190563B0|nr:ATP-binding protein [Sphaerospermopsis aphanizomenoides]